MRQNEVQKLGDGRHRADKGLYLEVRNNGRQRSWLFMIKIGGKRRVYGLGSAYTVVKNLPNLSQTGGRFNLALQQIRKSAEVQRPL